MRYVVVGTSGAGKTTFARALAERWAVPHFELDALHWGPNWTPHPHAEFAQAVETAAAADRWVCDGNYSAVRDVLWPRATHVLWLNFGRGTVWTRILRRTLWRSWTGAELWAGNRESLVTAFASRDSVLLWSLTTYRKNQRQYAALRQDPRYRHLIWNEFRSPRAADEWLGSTNGSSQPACHDESGGRLSVGD